MGLTQIAAGVILVALVACDAGTLPKTAPPRDPADPRAYQQDWFPTRSDEPLPLHLAIRADTPGEVQALLEQGADPNARWGQSGDHLPLREVFDGPGYGYRVTDQTEMVRLLLKHGADPNAKWCPFESRGPDLRACKSAHAFTPLMAAAGFGLADAVTMLLDAGADPRARTWNGESALDLAGTAVTFELISRALFPDIATRDRQALAWLRDDTVNPIWPDAALFHLTLTRASWFRNRFPPPPPGATEDPRTREQAIADSRRAEEGIAERFRMLLRIGANANQRVSDRDGVRTPLSDAVHWGHLRAARVLLAAGADVNARECRAIGVDVNKHKPFFEPACTPANGATLLMSIAGTGRLDAARLLLEFEADRSLKDWAGRTALDHASTREMKELLGAGR